MVGRPTQARTRSVGRYELLLELGKSPLGSLWLGKRNAEAGAELLVLRRVQLTRELSPADRELLADAARWSLGVSGECVVRNLDVVLDQGELALASEHHAGETLRSLLRLSNFKRQAIPSSIAASICIDVCRGLESALEHAALSPRGPNFVSGGLLPDSILVGTDGRTRLLDLGVAATWCGISAVAQHPEVTAYRAPEAVGETEAPTHDARSDIFTLGTLLWEMLSGGRRLFLGSSHSGVVQRVLTHPIPPVAGGASNDPPAAALLEVMQRALERDPTRRFPTLSSLTQALLGQNPAEPAAVAEYVNRIAKSTLDSRKRVVERSLKKTKIEPVLRQPGKATAPQAAEPMAAAVPRTPARARAAAAPASPPAARAAPISARPPPARQGGFAPPLAKPLPLPAQAKLGVAATGKAPPPPPDPTSLSEQEQPPNDPGSSVRAADIMRALAVEDEPESEQVATVRNPNAPNEARAAERALSEAPPPEPEAQSAVATPRVQPPVSDAALDAAASAVVTELTAGVTTPEHWQPRPKQDTTLGLGPDDLVPAGTAPADQAARVEPAAAKSRSTPVSEPPPPDILTTTRALAKLTGAKPPDIPRAPAVPKVEVERDAPRATATGAKRVPVALLAAGAAAALLLVIGLVFALGRSEDQGQTKAAEPEAMAPQKQAKASPKPAAPAEKPREAEAKAEPDTTQASTASESEEKDGSTDSEAEPQKNEEPTAETQTQAAPAKPVTRPRTVAPAPRPRAKTVKPKRKAKRSFIPSGI